MGELTGKVALVTGSSRGLGKGVALVLAEKGADVVVNYNSSRDEAEDVCKAVREFGVQSICVQANVGKAENQTMSNGFSPKSMKNSARSTFS